MTYPVTGPPPASPSDQWMVSADDVLVMDMSIGGPGEPAVYNEDLLSIRGGCSESYTSVNELRPTWQEYRVRIEASWGNAAVDQQ